MQCDHYELSITVSFLLYFHFTLDSYDRPSQPNIRFECIWNVRCSIVNYDKICTLPMTSQYLTKQRNMQVIHLSYWWLNVAPQTNIHLNKHIPGGLQESLAPAQLTAILAGLSSLTDRWQIYQTTAGNHFHLYLLVQHTYDHKAI